MKKGILSLAVMTSLLLVSQIAHSQTFSDVSPSGHTLYYWVDEYCDTCTSAYLVYSPNSHGPWYDTIEVSAYHNYTGNLVIPATVSYNGHTYNVTSIEGECFINCAGLISVTFPSSLKTINYSCFINCTGLTSITIPSSVTYINDYAFKNCIGLATINFNADSCYMYAQYGNNTYNHHVFSGCDNVSTINIGDNVRWVSPYAFQDCKNITNLTIGKNVETFYWNALADTLNSLITVNYNAINMKVRSSQQYGFNYMGLFEGRANTLSSLTIGNDVEKIQGLSFRNCTNLTSVVFNADSCTYVGSSEPAFSSCNNVTSFTFGNNVKVIPAYLCRHMEHLTTITLPNSVISIGDNSFGNCTGLTSVIIPDATKYVYWSFPNCTGLQSVTIGSSVESMNYAFKGCNHLTTINVRAEYPPTCNEETFENVPAYADVMVPCGAKYRYEVTDYWRNFSRITEDCDGIDGVEDDAIRVWADCGHIKVEGADGQAVRIFDMEGRMVTNGNLPTGVYMVKIGNHAAKKVVVIR